MQYVQREAFGWGATDAARAHPTRGLVVHYDGSDQGLAGQSHKVCVAYWRRTRAFHTGPSRGWLDIGYSFGACPHGFVFEGRGLGREQAAQPGGNTAWYSVTLMSGPSEEPTAAQVDAVRQLRAWLMGKGVGGAVRGHRDFISTSCPGDRLYALVRNGTFTGNPTSEEDDVSAKDVWSHELPVPWAEDTDNPEWQARSIIINTNQRLRAVQATLDGQGATIRELVAVLAQRDDEIDVEALVSRIEDAISGITVRLDVSDSPS